jgi:hypothetical protein
LVLLVFNDILARTAQDKKMLSRQIAAADGAIDKLAYELPPAGMIPPTGTLYGLAEEEIRIVEG